MCLFATKSRYGEQRRRHMNVKNVISAPSSSSSASTAFRSYHEPATLSGRYFCTLDRSCWCPLRVGPSGFSLTSAFNPLHITPCPCRSITTQIQLPFHQPIMPLSTYHAREQRLFRYNLWEPTRTRA